jgi:uncharacterized membrane protein (GlpM family)
MRSVESKVGVHGFGSFLWIFGDFFIFYIIFPYFPTFSLIFLCKICREYQTEPIPELQTNLSLTVREIIEKQIFIHFRYNFRNSSWI